MPYRTNITTRRIEWGECDPAGIVFYPRYFAMFDNATTLLFSAALGMTKYEFLNKYDCAGYPMVDTRARFLVPARFGDDVTIETAITEIKRSSFQITHHLKKDGALVRRGLRDPGVDRPRSGRPEQDQVSADPGRGDREAFAPLSAAPLRASRVAVRDLVQQRDQPVAAFLADQRDHAALVRLEHGLELAHQRAALRREVERIGALVARGLPPLGEPALLQCVEHADEIGPLDAERGRDLALRQPGIALDHGQHRELRRADVERRERAKKSWNTTSCARRST